MIFVLTHSKDQQFKLVSTRKSSALLDVLQQIAHGFTALLASASGSCAGDGRGQRIRLRFRNLLEDIAHKASNRFKKRETFSPAQMAPCWGLRSERRITESRLMATMAKRENKTAPHLRRYGTRPSSRSSGSGRSCCVMQPPGVEPHMRPTPEASCTVVSGHQREEIIVSQTLCPKLCALSLPRLGVW